MMRGQASNCLGRACCLMRWGQAANLLGRAHSLFRRGQGFNLLWLWHSLKEPRWRPPGKRWQQTWHALEDARAIVVFGGYPQLHGHINDAVLHKVGRGWAIEDTGGGLTPGLGTDPQRPWSGCSQSDAKSSAPQPAQWRGL